MILKWPDGTETTEPFGSTITGIKNGAGQRPSRILLEVSEVLNQRAMYSDYKQFNNYLLSLKRSAICSDPLVKMK